MNFTELLIKHDLDEKEYETLTEKNHGVTISEFRRTCPLRDWICSAFLLDRHTDRLRWHSANKEWMQLHK